MDVPAFQEIPMDALEFDRSDTRHSFEDEMSELYEAFYPSTTLHPHPLPLQIITSVPDPFRNSYTPPELTSPSDISFQLEQRQQLAALQSLQAQHQFQARQEHYYLQYHQQQQQEQLQHQQQNQQRKSGGIRKKRKMDQLKTIYRVPAENILTVDKWAWRKYGQKPIKGSPFPRNYYRCSSSKGCTARKQVERSITEPEVYVVTYTGDHFHPWPLHRNALAGISRSSSGHRIGCTVTHDLSCHVAAAASPYSDPPPTNSEDDGLLLIPNSKYVDEDMLRGMEELGKWKTTTSTTSNTSAIDRSTPTRFQLG